MTDAATGSGTEQEIVLLVDDNSTNLQVLYQTLDGRGYKLLIAKDGEQALRIAAKMNPHLILLDIMMPGIDGFETCRRLKADPATAGAAVIFLSALTESRDKVKGLGLGAVDYISKPFDADEVIARVETHLKIRRLERNLSEKNSVLETVNRRMRLDLESAARVQQALLPVDVPANPRFEFCWRYRPCQELAGDYLNIFSFDDRYLGMYVLDVSGHGVSAALLSFTVARNLCFTDARASMVSERSDSPPGYEVVSPARLAGRLNEAYPMDPRMRLYFTLVYGILDSVDGSFKFVSAGNQGPILLRKDGSAEILDIPAVPIGLMPDSTYAESSVRLEPGERLFLHSDGLSEERNAEGEEFGRQRMVELMRATQNDSIEHCVDALIDAVVAWRGSEDLRDDVAIVAAEYRAG